MKKIALLIMVFVVAAFARTETIELSGKYSDMLGNPFKRVLVEKTKSINIFSEDKEIVLKVEDNLNGRDYILNQAHADKVILKNKSVENVVEDFYSEDFKVNRSSENAVNVNIISGEIYLTYSNEKVSNVNHLMGVEVTLVVEINGVVRKIVMDQNVEKPIPYKGHIVSDDFDFNNISLEEKIKEILELIIFKGLKNENNN